MMFRARARALLLVAILLAAAAVPALARDNILYFNDSARPLGMGGAFTAVYDPGRNHLYNPAATIFNHEPQTAVSVTFDLVRGAYVFVRLLELNKDSWGDDDDKKLGGLLFLSLLLSTAQVEVGNDAWQFKLNVLDQLVTPGRDNPMYATSFSLGLKLQGALTGFQLGVTGHIYNIGSPQDPQGAGFSWGATYRPDGDKSPFSLGIFYFTADSAMGEIRMPFERIKNNTFNVGMTYELIERLTVNFDFRNLNNWNNGGAFQPHLGVERVWGVAGQGEDGVTFALRGGTYWDSDADSLGYSFGFEFRLLTDVGRTPAKGVFGHRSGYVYCGYSFTTERHVTPSRNNHIIALGLVL